MKWYEDLSVGNDAVDAQHKKLFEVVDNLIDACNQKKGKEEVANTLKFLLDYTKTHFKDEENLMLKNGYPKLADHKKEHELFAKDVSKTLEDYNKKGAELSFILQVMNQTNSWLLNHILKMDKEYGKFFKAKA